MGDLLEKAGVATEQAFGSRTPLTVFLGSMAMAEVGWLALILLTRTGAAVVVGLVGMVIVPLVAVWALRRMAKAAEGATERAS